MVAVEAPSREDAVNGSIERLRFENLTARRHGSKLVAVVYVMPI
jgi:hypothetical protein